MRDADTARFCPPEALFNDQAMPPVDVWAFGMIAVEVCRFT